MRRLSAAVVFTMTACTTAPTVGVAPARAPLQQLRWSIDSLVNQPQFARAMMGFLVVDPKTGDTLYSHNAGKLFMPASNQKLLTSSTALAQLGANYRYRTTFVTRGKVTNGDLDGDLIVIGRGDPTVSDRVKGNAMLFLQSIADSLAARGIHRILGALRAGGNAFPDSIYGYGWEVDDIRGESAAPVDELEFNEGMVQRRAMVAGRDTVISVATESPTDAYLGALHTALANRNVVVVRQITQGIDSLAGPVDTVFSYYSPPLREILKPFLKPSQNQIGEALIKTLGLEKTGVGIADSGAAVIKRQLLTWGIDSASTVIYDGSGMSRHNLVTPEAIVKILIGMQKDTAFTAFYDALPIIGVDGTTRTRMLGSAAVNNFRAKTGTLEFVRSLSGYATTAAGEKLVFSMMENHYPGSVSDINKLQDAVGILLANYRGTSSQ
ncbi:MAG TPA: D-alanyl-D-alanine carboxypeptidase/D-alanyl-D-alanine-endopeptidase [Gemmatimonadaceae bacterium]|nr:D-alanyl-D-alanine carboxypeptidase/D-alanyl-D-alanine-endopeptidase [Gemmatimonadaceae bacterium]